eukprot:2279833-Amphidinium_carterae.1
MSLLRSFYYCRYTDFMGNFVHIVDLVKADRPGQFMSIFTSIALSHSDIFHPYACPLRAISCKLACPSICKINAAQRIQTGRDKQAIQRHKFSTMQQCSDTT